MKEIEQLLEPIPGDNPAGKNLRYSLYDAIKEARREEDSGPRGEWEQREIKTANFGQVIKISEQALRQSSKDLWIAAWLTEAWIYEYGMPGLTSGLQLAEGLITRFWDGLYPELDEEDVEPRLPPLEWVGSYFDPSKGSSPILALRRVALTNKGFNWFDYQDSHRGASGGEGKITREEWNKDFEATKKQFYKDLERDSKASLQALASLDASCHARFGDLAPSLRPLRTALEELENLVHILLSEKLKKEPDLAEPGTKSVAVAGGPTEVHGRAEISEIAAVQQLDISKLSGEITAVEHAALHVAAAAQFIRHNDPSSPISYLLLRALRWGEVRAAGESAINDLPAPPSDLRVALKTSAGAKSWGSVLETAEAAMSTAIGRAWLDLQRYAIRACDELGYSAAAKAMRSELKAFLQDFPALAAATLSDDTGTANPETLAWLRQEGLIS